MSELAPHPAGISAAGRAAVGQMLAEATFSLMVRTLGPLGIDLIVLKGPHLAAVAYEQTWQRDYCDLDVLVRARDFDRAVAALIGRGFHLHTAEEGREATFDQYYNRSLGSPLGWVVEVHRAFAGYGLFQVDYEALFSRAVPFRFGKVRALGLSNEDLLLHLVIHTAKSHFSGIERKHVTDIAQLVGRQWIDWETFVARSKAAGCRTASWVLLTAAMKAEGARVPAEVLRALLPSKARRLWVGPWLDLSRFPLVRHPELPTWLFRILVGPAIVDGLRKQVTSGLRFAAVRVRDGLGR